MANQQPDERKADADFVRTSCRNPSMGILADIPKKSETMPPKSDSKVSKRKRRKPFAGSRRPLFGAIIGFASDDTNKTLCSNDENKREWYDKLFRVLKKERLTTKTMKKHGKKSYHRRALRQTVADLMRQYSRTGNTSTNTFMAKGEEAIREDLLECLRNEGHLCKSMDIEKSIGASEQGLSSETQQMALDAQLSHHMNTATQCASKFDMPCKDNVDLDINSKPRRGVWSSAEIQMKDRRQLEAVIDPGPVASKLNERIPPEPRESYEESAVFVDKPSLTTSSGSRSDEDASPREYDDLFSKPASGQWAYVGHLGAKIGQTEEDMKDIFASIEATVRTALERSEIPISAPAEFEISPTKELEELYTCMFGEPCWKMTAAELQREQVPRVFDVLLALLGTALYKWVFNEATEWQETSYVTFTSEQYRTNFEAVVSKHSDVDVETLLRAAAHRTVEDPNYHAERLAAKAERLALDLDLVLAPHLSRLSTRVPLNRQFVFGDTWRSGLSEIFMKALLVTERLQIGRFKFSFCWIPSGKPFERKSMEDRYPVENNNVVLLTLFPSVRIHKEILHGVRNTTKVMVIGGKSH